VVGAKIIFSPGLIKPEIKRVDERVSLKNHAEISWDTRYFGIVNKQSRQLFRALPLSLVPPNI